jgi:hypothetical protein
MEKTDLAWAAGIVDGEGCIYVHKRKGTRKNSILYTLVLKVNMTHSDTILRLHSIFCVGHVNTLNKVTVNGKKQYMWRVTSLNAANVLKLMHPYLVTKQKEAEEAFKFNNLPKFPGNKPVSAELSAQREFIYLKLRELKKM